MKIFKKIFSFFIYAVSFGLVFLLLAFFYFSRTLPTVEEISRRQISQSTKIFDRTGTILLYEVSNGKERTVIPFSEIPKRLKDATIAIEDKRFYESPGFDLKSILRALWSNLKTSNNPFEGQGASTITQQLARNAFLTSERTITRKIKELILSWRISRNYSKDKILELYLNEIPYGSTIYGIEAASQSYFGKSAKDLDLAEAAILAALPKAPTYYSPWGSHIKELFDRQKLVLQKMLDLGKISKEDFNRATKEKIAFLSQDKGLRAPHFTLQVRDYLIQKYGEGMVTNGGLRVKTTLDWDLQQIAEEAVKSGAEENDRLYDGKNAALVAENPKTGEILALVGSRDYFATSSLPEGCTPGSNCKFEPNFDVATLGLRQPGSALKPFVYLTAFEKGYAPQTVVFDVPTEFASDNPNCPLTVNFEAEENKECFHPQNFDEKFRGPVQLKQALGQSINIPAVKVLYLAGVADAVKKANLFGLKTLTSPNLYGLSLVLGGGAVRLTDLVGAYSALAADGIYRSQSMILEVRDANGNVLESNKPEEKRVSDPQSVRLINNILSDTEIRSGLLQNSLYLTLFPDYDVALKTGTSNDYRDAWAIGYTPSFTVGVWAGNNDNSPMQRRGSSILAAVPIWSKFMSVSIKKFSPETFTRPDPVAPEKPVLAGDYLRDKQVHSILYYVDRKNPLGPTPVNASSDPQFANWETPVLAWARDNIANFQTYNQTNPLITTQGSLFFTPKIEIKEPLSGAFVKNHVPITAEISTANPIAQINVYWNGIQLQGFGVSVGNFYIFNWDLRPPIFSAQNLLEIEAVDSWGFSLKKGVIVYAQ